MTDSDNNSRFIKLSKNKIFLQMARFLAVSVVGYVILIVSTYVQVEFFFINKSFAYLIGLTLLNFWVYYASRKFVFKVEHNKEKIYKYLLYLTSFWFINNIAYNILIYVFELWYVFAVMANIATFGVAKFLVQKYFVFK